MKIMMMYVHACACKRARVRVFEPMQELSLLEMLLQIAKKVHKWNNNAGRNVHLLAVVELAAPSVVFFLFASAGLRLTRKRCGAGAPCPRRKVDIKWPAAS